MGPKKNNIKNNETGSGLVLVLMVLVVLSTLGLSLGAVTVGSFRLGHINQDSSSAYYIAEAGANIAYEEMKSIVEDKYKDNQTSDAFFTAMSKPLKTDEVFNATKTYGNGYFDPQRGEIPEANVKVTGGSVVEREGAQGKERVKSYIIESTGTVDGGTRTVEREVNITWKDKVKAGSNIPLPPNDAAITVNGDLTANVMPTVNGTVYKTTDGKFKIDNNNGGENFKGANDTKIISETEWERLSKITIPIPNKPSVASNNKRNDIKISNSKDQPFPVYEDSYMNTLSIQGNAVLSVDTGGKAVTLVVDNLALNDAKIRLTNGGSLTLYYTGGGNLIIQNSFSMTGNIVAPNAHIEQSGSPFQITGDLITGGHIELKNAPKVTGNLLAKGHIEVKGGNTEVNGLIMSTNGHIKFHNNSTINSLVIAPNGNFSMQDNTNLTGSLVARSINFSNNVTVTHSLDYLKYLPGGHGAGAGSTEMGLGDLISSTPAIEN